MSKQRLILQTVIAHEKEYRELESILKYHSEMLLLQRDEPLRKHYRRNMARCMDSMAELRYTTQQRLNAIGRMSN